MNERNAHQPRIAIASRVIFPDGRARRVYLRRMQRFRIAIHRVRGTYLAQVADLPGCCSRGQSEVEALENARAAIRAYMLLMQAVEDGAATVQLEISA